MFVLIFVILIVMSAAILKKVITIMKKTSDYFAEKNREVSHKKEAPLLLCFMKEQSIEEKVDNWKKYS
jgi:hypothetical protein